jgi:hypothetical protein
VKDPIFDFVEPQESGRRCGGCTLCCKLLPVREVDKGAGERCRHQRTGKGCAIYAKRPMTCQLWSCAWLSSPAETADLRRPDRSRYVVDNMPDFVTFTYPDRPDVKVPVIQVWVDPAEPDAHRDPALRAYLERRGADGFMALIRSNDLDAFLLCPPNMAADGEWHEERSNQRAAQHSAAEIYSLLHEKSSDVT